MGRKRLTLGNKFSVGKPGKPSPGQQTQEIGAGIALTIIGIGIGALFLMAAIKGCNEELERTQRSAQVTTMR